MTRPLRLLVINWQDPANPRAGGAEVHLREIFGRLGARGHEVTLLASGWPGCARRERADGFEIHRVGGRYSFALRAPFYHRRVLAQRPFDIVIEDLNKIPLYVPAWTERPVVVIVHHLFGGSAFGAAAFPVAAATWVLEQTLPLGYRGVPLQAVSESTAEDLCRHGLRDEDITVIRNGVAIDPHMPVARAAEPTFLYLGRLQAYKRVDLILRAMARLRAQIPSARLVVAGRGPEERRLRGLARSEGLGDGVAFAGFVTEQAKRDLLAQAWANVVMSTKEGWGITVLEAGAVGTATVASSAPGLRDAVQDGVTGLLVGPGDVTALADALARLARDREYTRSLGRAARLLAERSTWDDAAEQTEAHLQAMVDGSSDVTGNSLRVRRRDQRVRVPLPRNGTGHAPFGWSEFWVEGGWGRVRVGMRCVLCAVDRMGREPRLVLDQMECPDATARSVVALRCRPGELAALDGWPADPVAFITRRLEQLLGGTWRIGREAGARPRPGGTAPSTGDVASPWRELKPIQRRCRAVQHRAELAERFWYRGRYRATVAGFRGKREHLLPGHPLTTEPP